MDVLRSAHWWECPDCEKQGPPFASEGAALSNYEEHRFDEHPEHEPEDG